MGTIDTGYQFKITEKARDVIEFDCNISQLESMKEVNLQDCVVDLPAMTAMGGQRVLILRVGETSEFTDRQFQFTVKRTN